MQPCFGTVARTERPEMTPAEIKSLRSHLNLTQANFGSLIGKAARTVMAYESGTRKISRSSEIILSELRIKAHR